MAYALFKSLLGFNLKWDASVPKLLTSQIFSKPHILKQITLTIFCMSNNKVYTLFWMLWGLSQSWDVDVPICS